MTTRVGVIGYGAIGRALSAHVASSPAYDLGFVVGRTPVPVDEFDGRICSSRLTDGLLAQVDLVIEAAHPDVVSRVGAQVLTAADLMILSVGALADDHVLTRLVSAANRSDSRLIVPHGALVGLESLLATRDTWSDVTITFVKPPGSVEPTPDDLSGRVVLYDGPVRGVASLYPRNVNAMVACALATVGLDDCRARLISEPAATVGTLEIEAHGTDGSRLLIHKQQPMDGVSGTEMGRSIIYSLDRWASASAGLVFA